MLHWFDCNLYDRRSLTHPQTMKTALEFANYLDANLKKPWSSKADIDLMAKEIEQRDQEKINEGKRLAAQVLLSHGMTMINTHTAAAEITASIT